MGASRIPAVAVEVAETLLSSSVLPAIGHPLHLLQLHQEALVFRGERVGVNDGRREQIGERAFLLTAAQEAPVDGEPDLVNRFAGHLHGLDACSAWRGGLWPPGTPSAHSARPRAPRQTVKG